MTPAGARRLVVGRLRKPHGLKGDVTVFPLTDAPDTVFAPGRSVWVVDIEGDILAGPLRLARGRAYHREWLVAFEGHPDRDAVEPYAGTFLAVPAESLAPPEGDEVYLHELSGFAVRDVEGNAVGLVSGWYEVPGGLMLEVQGPKREFLLPYRKEFVVGVDREARRLTVQLPEGMEEL